MKKRLAPKKSVPSFFMFATILVAITVPLVVAELTGDGTFDTRNSAYERGVPTSDNPCIIYFPKVNPETLEVNGSYRLSVDAISDVKDIQGIKIINNSGDTLFEKEYTSLSNSVSEHFTYTPTKTGEDFLRGSLVKVTGEEACSGQSIKVVSQNRAPEITSEEKNYDLTVGEDFEYTIVAQDLDSDIINYAYSFTPRADWLQRVIIEDGSDGKVKIKLQGTPDRPASYLAHIFVHDGYGNHLSSSSWIINVNQGENDIPAVRILTPSEEMIVNQGSTLKTKWLASDQNQIVKYQIYMSQDPADESTWTVVNEEISYKNTQYDINTSTISGGVYRMIVRAIDNQTPQGIGLAVSPEITIEGDKIEDGNKVKEPDQNEDDMILVKPQVINMTPNSSAQVENPRPIIRATLISGSDSTIVEDSIIFKLNDREIEEGVRFNKISDGEITLIYQSEEDIKPGIQKITISFSDSNENSVEKEWSFVIADTTIEEDPNIINIFGLELSKKIALIIGAGIVVIILAILVPIIIYNMWSKDSDLNARNKELPPKIPKSGMFALKEDVNTPSEEAIPVVEKEIEEDHFSTLKSEEIDEGKAKTVESDSTPTESIEKETDSVEETKEAKDAWTPQITDSANNEPVTPSEEAPQIPDLAVPTAETFSSQTTPNTTPPVEKDNTAQRDALASPDAKEIQTEIPTQDKTMDEIAQLYQEIQKVDDEDNSNQNENS